MFDGDTTKTFCTKGRKAERIQQQKFLGEVELRSLFSLHCCLEKHRNTNLTYYRSKSSNTRASLDH